MGDSKGVSVMVSVVLILLVLLLAGSALLVLYGRLATRSSEGRLLSFLQTEFLNLQSSLWKMEKGEELEVNLRLSIEKPLLSAWGGRAGRLQLVPSGPLYMRRITITNQKNYPLSDFPVKVELTSTNFDFSKVKPDGGDIRFYRGEVPLRYYIESWTPSNAVIWVNVPYLPASGTESIEMYYGMEGVESASDPSALWLIMEDMSSPPKGTLKGVAEYIPSRGYVRLTPNKGSLNGQLEYRLNPGEGFLAKFELWAGLFTEFPGGEGGDATWLYAYCTSTPTDEDRNAGGYHFIFDEYDDQIQIKWAGSTVFTVQITDIDNLTWHSIEIRHWRKAAGENENTEIWYDGVRVCSLQDSPRSKTGTFFGWGARTGGTNNEHRIRNLYVRKYTDPEPSVVLGSEERILERPFVGLGFGSLEVETRGWFTPTTRFVLEGGAVLVEDVKGCRMLSPPLLLEGEGNTLLLTYLLLEGPFLEVSSLGERKLSLRCINIGYTEMPVGGPNRENVVVDLSSMVRPKYRKAWQVYLEDLRNKLNSRGLNASLDTLNPLRLTILGTNTSAGIKDLYYYERIMEVKVEAVA